MSPDDNTNLSSIADYYASQGMSNPQLSYDANGNPIYTAGGNSGLPVDVSNLKDYAATLTSTASNPLPTHEVYRPPATQDAYNALTGSNGVDRFQLFPERIARSALSLPADVMSGTVMTPSTMRSSGSEEDFSSDPLLQRVQDMAALMGGGGMQMAEKGALGSAIKIGEIEPLLQNGYTRLYRGESANNANGGYYTTDKEYASGHGNLKYVDLPNQDADFFKMPGMKNIYNLTNYEAGPSKTNWRLNVNTLKSDNEAAAPVAALENAPVFHSAVENAVNTASMKSAPPQQWLSTIANSKGVKPEELDWTGLKDWLGEQSGPVSKEQVQGYLQYNKMGLGEVNKGQVGLHIEPNEKEPHILQVYRADDPTGEHSGMVGEIIKGDNGYQINVPELPRKIFTTQQSAEDYISSKTDFGTQTKYSKYQLPGGENYREKLLTLPEKAGDPGPKGWGNTAGETLKNANPENYRSSHWDEPNILAHIRMNDRTVEGKNALHIEEIQSDWLQAHRNEQVKIKEAVNKDFDTIANKMVQAGVIKKICD